MNEITWTITREELLGRYKRYAPLALPPVVIITVSGLFVAWQGSGLVIDSNSIWVTIEPDKVSGAHSLILSKLNYVSAESINKKAGNAGYILGSILAVTIIFLVLMYVE